MRHTIDTLRITRKLESVGVDRRQAEAHAEALNEVVVTEYSELATKTDLERFATKEDLARLETRMIRLWAFSTVTLATLIISMPFVAG